MNEDHIVVAVDLGSTRFRCVVAGPAREGGVAPQGFASRPAAGIRRGQLDDLPKAAATLGAVIDEALEMADVDALPVYITVGGDSVRCFDSHGAIPLDARGAAIGDEHLQAVRERVQAVDVPFDRVILHCLPIEYSVDDDEGLENPVGRVGSRLELEAHLVTATQSGLGAVEQAVDLAGLGVQEQVFDVWATSRALVPAERRRGGCLLIDIGGEATHYALFHRGRLRRSGSVPVGGNHVTRDLAFVLEMGENEAEALKRRFGSARKHGAGARPVAFDDDAPSAEAQSRIAAVSEARQAEILELVAQALQWGITRPSLPGGILLYGGGARLAGTEELAEQIFDVQALRCRYNADDRGTEPESWATAIGLAQLALEQDAPLRAAAAVGAGGHDGLLGRLQRWFDRLT